MLTTPLTPALRAPLAACRLLLPVACCCLLPYSVFERDGVQVVCDTVSMGFLKGAVVEFEDSLMRSAFQVGLSSTHANGSLNERYLACATNCQSNRGRSLSLHASPDSICCLGIGCLCRAVRTRMRNRCGCTPYGWMWAQPTAES
jgi:hypothetical protein